MAFATVDITGNVTENGVVPSDAKIYVHDAVTGALVASTTANQTTGEYLMSQVATNDFYLSVGKNGFTPTIEGPIDPTTLTPYEESTEVFGDDFLANPNDNTGDVYVTGHSPEWNGNLTRWTASHSPTFGVKSLWEDVGNGGYFTFHTSYTAATAQAYINLTDTVTPAIDFSKTLTITTSQEAHSGFDHPVEVGIWNSTTGSFILISNEQATFNNHAGGPHIYVNVNGVDRGRIRTDFAGYDPALASLDQRMELIIDWTARTITYRRVALVSINTIFAGDTTEYVYNMDDIDPTMDSSMFTSTGSVFGVVVQRGASNSSSSSRFGPSVYDMIINETALITPPKDKNLVTNSTPYDPTNIDFTVS